MSAGDRVRRSLMTDPALQFKNLTDLFRSRLTPLIGLALIMGTLALYWPVRHHDFVNYDDGKFVSKNIHVRAGLTWDSIKWALTADLVTPAFNADYWTPVTFLSHMITVELFGMEPSAHHLVNLLLHFLNTLLLFLLLRWMTGALWPSAAVAALFAIHPLHVESVAWISERKDVLSMFFGLLTIGAYVRYSRVPTVGRYLVMVLAFALGLMSKAMLVTLPCLLLLIDYWPLGRLRPVGWRDVAERIIWWHLVKEKLPLFGMAAACLLITYLALERDEALYSLATLPFGARLANALVAYVAYIKMMFWPTGLAVIYPHPGATLPLWQPVAAAVVLVAISLLVMMGGRRWPYGVTGWFWYLGTLVPVVGLVQAGEQAMADRYTYLPLIGLFLIIAWGVADFVNGRLERKIAMALVAGVVLSLLFVGARVQVGYWRNSITLFEQTLRVTSDNHVAHNSLGGALAKRGKRDEAVAQYREALRIKPSYTRARSNLGLLLTEQGKLDEAIAHFSRVLEIRPNYASAHNNLGLALARQRDLPRAVAHYTESLRLRPDNEKAHNNLGLALAEQGKLPEALAHYAESLRLRPDYEKAHNNLGIALAEQGKLPEGMAHFSEAVRIDPAFAEAHINLGLVLAQQGKLTEAIAHYSQALEIQPGLASVRRHLEEARLRQTGGR